MVEFPSSGPFKKKLVVVMSLHEIPISAGGNGQLRLVSDELKKLADAHAEEVCKTLAEILPPYMVPTVRIVVEDMPYTPSGKINRVRVRTWLNTLDDETYNQLLDRDEQLKDEGPTTDLEQSLRRIWSVALHLEINQISLRKAFFQLGGDSILAMQVMALSREEGLDVTVQDIIRSRNIPELAQFVEAAAKNSIQVLNKRLNKSNDAVADSDHGFRGISPAQTLLLSRKENVIQYRFSLDHKVTFSVLKECRRALRTEPIEGILAALVHSFSSVFPGCHAPTIFNQNDGRELWRSETTAHGVIDILRQFKESRRARNLPRGKVQAELILDCPSLREYGDDLLKPTSSSTVTQNTLVSLVSEVRNESLEISLSYNRAMRCGDRMLAWMRRFKLSLMDLNKRLLATTPSLAPVDFPLVSLNDDKLNELVEVIMPIIGQGIQDIEDIYPCSPLQQGILVSQMQDTKAGLYEDREVWEVLPRVPNSTVDPTRLEQAWQEVVARHGMLRTVLVQGIASDGIFGQVVLSKHQAKTSNFQFSSYDEWRVSTKEPMDYIGLHPPHRLTICTTPDNRVFCELESNHAISDGQSRAVIFRDFSLAYDNLLPCGSGPRYSEYISYITEQDVSSGAYWKSYLASIAPSHFPALVDTTESTRELLFSKITPTVSTKSLNEFCAANGTTLSTLFQLIWALVLRSYTGSDDVCFGFVNSGRDTPIDRIQDAVGPFLSILTSRVTFSDDDAATQVLEKLQADFVNSLPHQHFGMAEIQRTLGMPGEPLFNSGMSFRKSTIEKLDASISFKPLDEVGRTEYDVTVVIDMVDDVVNIGLCHWTSRLSQQHAINVIETFDSLLSRVVQNPSQRIGDLDVLSGRDRAQIRQWNIKEPELVHDCIHTSIERQVAIRPTAPAVDSWDGQLTYLELDAMAEKLALHLMSHGVGPKDIIPLCFEKSVFVLISMVAVLKAGGVLAVLDPSNPIKRLQEITSQVQAKVVIASRMHSDKFLTSVDRRTLVVDQELLDNLPPCSRPLNTQVNPDDAAYVISTSGSTGKPKIVVVPHAAFCSGARGQASASGIGPDSRVLQFASFAFDVSIMETFTSLMYGACVCIPSEAARSTSIADLINSMQITWAFLTPSVNKTIRPEEVPRLKTLILGGEALLKSNIEIWSEKLHLMNGYGPSECSVAATVNTAISRHTSPANIGRAIGGRCWIVDAHDHNKLLPVGVIGELLIQGPILARGYLGDAEKTAAAFIENPAWLLGDEKWTRFYKTGDLVRYSSSGDIMFVGRKDTQVKVRGQRLELGEVEYNLSMSQHISHSIVCIPSKGPFKGQLIAALSLAGLDSAVSSSADDSIELVSRDGNERSSSRIMEISESMSKSLPSYMVPTAWAALRKFPLLPSGKLDRSRIKAWLDNLDNATYRLILDLQQQNVDVFGSLMEEKLRTIWAAVLTTPVEEIGRGVSFFSLGGDSIMAMQVVARCRLENINLTLQDIVRYKTIAVLAAFVESRHSSGSASAESAPSSGSDTSDTIPDDLSSNTELSNVDLKDFIADQL